MTKEEFLGAVAETKERIQAGDVFQLVLSQRFQRQTHADPFDIYRLVNRNAHPQLCQHCNTLLILLHPEL